MTIPIEEGFLPPDAGVLAAESNAYVPAEPITKAGGVLARHLDWLMALPGVVMVGESLDPIGQPAILIGVKTSGDLTRMPKEIEGVPVIREVIGEVDAY